MKHVGLNVASDTFMTYMYVGCRVVILLFLRTTVLSFVSKRAGYRYFALFRWCTMLEPTTPQEAKEMTRIGFEISEKLLLPLLLRTTTRWTICEVRSRFNALQQPRKKGYFKKDPLLVTVPATARAKHPVLLKHLEEAEKISENHPSMKSLLLVNQRRWIVHLRRFLYVCKRNGRGAGSEC